MKIQIRQSVFETNSSSTHSITMCDEGKFDRFKNGELLFDIYDECLVEKSDADEEEGRYYTYDQFFGGDLEYETYIDSYTTAKGEKVVAFGYYGHD